MNRQKQINRAMQRVRKVIPFGSNPIDVSILCALLDAGNYPLDTPVDVMMALVGVDPPRSGFARGDWLWVMRAYSRLERRLFMENRRRREVNPRWAMVTHGWIVGIDGVRRHVRNGVVIHET